MRYAWLPDTERQRVGGLGRLGLDAFRGHLRRIDLAASRRPHAYAAISEAIRDRIQRFYGRDAVVIHPPVEIGEFDAAVEKEPGRFLWVHRLVPYKHPELVAEAFRGLPYQLTMVGVGPLEEKLRANLPPNVELLGWVSREELARLYSRAEGFVHIGEEDFGITMVEALAAGTPVVALNAGGARDIVRDGVDGILIEHAELDELRQAVRSLADREWDPAALVVRARSFSSERFVERLREWIDDASRTVRGRPLDDGGAGA
jgi:glycosyltransferase involved in cell wall biosynthesis